MIALARLIWNGLPGGSGVTTLAFAEAPTDPGAFSDNDANALLSACRNLVGGFVSFLPSSVSVGPHPEIAVHDTASGALAYVKVAPAPGNAFTGTDTTSYSAASGACISWNTNTVVRGRRVRGRTFIVPLGGTGYDSTGTLSSSVVTNGSQAIQTFLSTLTPMFFEPCVWSRPTGPGLNDGVAAFITGGNIRDRAAVLTGRRS